MRERKTKPKAPKVKKRPGAPMKSSTIAIIRALLKGERPVALAVRFKKCTSFVYRLRSRYPQLFEQIEGELQAELQEAEPQAEVSG